MSEIDRAGLRWLLDAATPRRCEGPLRAGLIGLAGFHPRTCAGVAPSPTDQTEPKGTTHDHRNHQPTAALPAA